jgi:hypothetical protein
MNHGRIIPMPRALLHGLAPFVRAEGHNPRELFAQFGLQWVYGDSNPNPRASVLGSKPRQTEAGA